ncbi:MAG: 3-deoxy-manno-octulosonate cytidylyltransferase [Elusimicrobiota bacterium]
MNEGCIIVIPARYASSRFPGKVLKPLGGKSVLEWCFRAAWSARLGPVLIATEDLRVVAAARSFGARAILTSPNCASGTDRVYQAVKKHPAPRIINLQADQPFISASTLRRIDKILRSNSEADITTAVIPLADVQRAQDPNVVKAVIAKNGRCLYFSRSSIPYPRGSATVKRFEHLGIYGFARKSLERFVSLKPSALEKTESLEQLRALEDGLSIFAAAVADPPIAIDTPADLKRAELFFKNMRTSGKA